MKLSYTTDELVEQTGLTRQRIYLLVDTGHLNPIKLGKKYIFEHQDVVDCLNWCKGRDINNLANLKK